MAHLNICTVLFTSYTRMKWCCHYYLLHTQRRNRAAIFPEGCCRTPPQRRHCCPGYPSQLYYSTYIFPTLFTVTHYH